MRPFAALAAVLVVTARPGLAQRRATPPEEPFVFRYLAYPAWDLLEGFSANGTFALRRPPRRGPIATTATIELTARVSSSGTRGAQLVFNYPGWWPGWRLITLAGIERAQRAPYFGIGNDTEVSDSLDRANGDLPYYRYSLLRTSFMAQVQRKLVGRTRLLAGVRWRHTRALPLENAVTALSDDLARGMVSDTGGMDMLEARYGLMLDTRNEEASPARGVYLEALGASSLSGPSYDRWLFGARAFLPIGEFTTLAVRQQVELGSGGMPFHVQYERLTAWRPEDGFGGQTTLRTHVPGRFLAPNRWIASLDLRYRKYDIPLPTSPVRLWLLAFADAGRLWESDEAFSLSGLHLDAGGGFRLQFSKGTLFGLDVGFNNDAIWGISLGLGFAF